MAYRTERGLTKRHRDNSLNENCCSISKRHSGQFLLLNKSALEAKFFHNRQTEPVPACLIFHKGAADRILDRQTLDNFVDETRSSNIDYDFFFVI